MAKKKNLKKKNVSKLTVDAIEKKVNYKKKTVKKDYSYNHNNNKNKKPYNYKNNNRNTTKGPNKVPTKKVTEIVKPKIYDQELEEDLEIPIIQKTIAEKNHPKEETKEEKNNINNKEIEAKIEAKIEEKLDDRIDEKINEKLHETGELFPIEQTEKKEKKPSSRQLAKKEDVFSKITEWFTNLTNEINDGIRKRKVTNIKKAGTKVKKSSKKIANEEVKTRVYPKNKFLKALAIIHDNLYILFDTIIIFTFIILLVGMYRVQVIPSSTIKYIACIVGFLSLVAISLNKYISGRIFTILITAGMVGGIYYLNYTYDFINNLNTKLYEYQEYYVVALDNGRNKSIYNINNKRVGLLEENANNVKHVLNTKLEHVTYITYKNQDRLYEEFIELKTRAIIVKENQYKYIQNNNIKPDIKVKILYKFNVNTKKQGE